MAFDSLLAEADEAPRRWADRRCSSPSTGGLRALVGVADPDQGVDAGGTPRCCAMSGSRIVMVTGDSRATAESGRAQARHRRRRGRGVAGAEERDRSSSAGQGPAGGDGRRRRQRRPALAQADVGIAIAIRRVKRSSNLTPVGPAPHDAGDLTAPRKRFQIRTAPGVRPSGRRRTIRISISPSIRPW